MEDEELYAEIRRRFSGLYRVRYENEWEDAIHDTFVSFIVAQRRGVILDDARYLTGIARLQWAKHCERKDALYRSLEIYPAVSHPPTPGDVQALNERLRRLDSSIKNLTPIRRAVIEHCLAGESLKEVKSSLGITQTQFRLAKWRGVQDLKLWLTQGNSNNGSIY